MAARCLTGLHGGAVRTGAQSTSEHRDGAESTAAVPEDQDLRDRVEALEAEVERKDETIADLEARGEAATRKRNHLTEELERVEELAEAATPLNADADADGDAETAEADKEATDAPQTPLEQVAGLPEHLATEELTANQERAQFVTPGYPGLCEKMAVGYAVPSTDLRKVLKAKVRPRTQTVTRVLDFLDNLGDEGTTLVKRHGTKRIAFSEEAVERLDEYAARASRR